MTYVTVTEKNREKETTELLDRRLWPVIEHGTSKIQTQRDISLCSHVKYVFINRSCWRKSTIHRLLECLVTFNLHYLHITIAEIMPVRYEQPL